MRVYSSKPLKYDMQVSSQAELKSLCELRLVQRLESSIENRSLTHIVFNASSSRNLGNQAGGLGAATFYDM